MPSHRRDAYQEGRNLPSPVVAPEIWHRLLPVLVKERDELKAKYTLFLANPVGQLCHYGSRIDLKSSSHSSLILGGP